MADVLVRARPLPVANHRRDRWQASSAHQHIKSCGTDPGSYFRSACHCCWGHVIMQSIWLWNGLHDDYAHGHFILGGSHWLGPWVQAPCAQTLGGRTRHHRGSDVLDVHWSFICNFRRWRLCVQILQHSAFPPWLSDFRICCECARALQRIVVVERTGDGVEREPFSWGVHRSLQNFHTIDPTQRVSAADRHECPFIPGSHCVRLPRILYDHDDDIVEPDPGDLDGLTNEALRRVPGIYIDYPSASVSTVLWAWDHCHYYLFLRCDNTDTLLSQNSEGVKGNC